MLIQKGLAPVITRLSSQRPGKACKVVLGRKAITLMSFILKGFEEMVDKHIRQPGKSSGSLNKPSDHGEGFQGTWSGWLGSMLSSRMSETSQAGVGSLASALEPPG